MARVIPCPQCQRRLRLPDDFRDADVCCPSCAAVFSAQSALSNAPTPSSPAQPPRGESARAAEPRRFGDGADRARRPAADRVVRRPHDRSWFVVFLGVLLGGSLLAGVIGLLVINDTSPPASFSSTVTAPTAITRKEVRQDPPVPALPGPPAPVPPAGKEDLIGDLSTLFERMGAAARAGDSKRFISHFDTPRLAEELFAQRIILIRNEEERQAIRRDLDLGNSNKLTAGLIWATFEIRQFERINDDDVVVVVRHRTANGSILKARWWVTRASGTWEVYDFENAEISLRLSVLATSQIQQAGLDLHDLVRGIQILSDAMETLQRGETDAAEKKLEGIAEIRFPRQVEAVRRLGVARLRIQRGSFKEALEALDQAEALRPDMPLLDYLRGVACSRLGQYPVALKHLEAYRDLLGEDLRICYELGWTLNGLQRFTDAAFQYRRALDIEPTSFQAFRQLLYNEGGDDGKLDDLGTRFVKLPDLERNFDICAADCEKRNYPELMEPIARSMRELHPDHAPSFYYLALGRAKAGAGDEAVDLLASALRRQPDAGKRLGYARGVAKRLSPKHLAEVYAAVADGRDVFPALAAEAMKRYQTEVLRRLVTAHRARYPDDPLLPWYQAVIYAQEGRDARAERAFTAALAEPPDAETLRSFRELRVRTRYNLGKGLSAYEDIGPVKETFLQLGLLCLANDDFELLQALVEAHAKQEPDDLETARFRCLLSVEQGRTAEAVASFEALLAQAPADRHKGLVREFLSRMADAGKVVEAYQAAPDGVAAFAYLADELLEDDRYTELGKLIMAHRARHPMDPDLFRYEAEVHLQNKAWDEAARVLREGMKTAPENRRDAYRYRLVFALYQAGRWRRAYAEVGPRSATFQQLAFALENDRKGADLEELITAHRPHAAARDPEFLHHAFVAKVMQKKTDEASLLLRTALEQQGDADQKRYYITVFVSEMNTAGLPFEGYRASPDKSAAFDALAARFVAGGKDKDLAGLLEEHGKEPEQSPAYQRYKGELLLLRKDFAGATRCLTAALATAPPRERPACRHALFRARVKSGEVVNAYRDQEPGDATFETLVALCLQEKDAGQLRALIDAHRRDHADDPNLAFSEVQVAWLERDYEGVLRLLTEKNEDLDMPRFRYRCDDYRVRSLVRSKQPREAVRAAETLTKRLGRYPLLLLLAHAADGDVPGVLSLMEKNRSNTYLLKECYKDEDLGPLLRGESMKEVREKFPEPANPD